jgi:hypothetical protein
MLNETQKLDKYHAIVISARYAASKTKIQPHHYASKGKKAKKTINIRPPNPYKKGSSYYKDWNRAFHAHN